MTRIVVRVLVWDVWNKEHIKKHRVTQQEVEETVCRLIAHKHSHKGRYMLIGRSGKRIISTIVRRQKANTYYIVTARDSDKKERRIVYEKEKKQNTNV